MDDWDEMIDVNVKGLLYGIGHALPVMLGATDAGTSINVSSVAGRRLFSHRGGVLRQRSTPCTRSPRDCRRELAERAAEATATRSA